LYMHIPVYSYIYIYIYMYILSEDVRRQCAQA
jgi:hypothetical protein